MDRTEDPWRWRLIEELYHAALDRPADARSAFLAEACPSDPGLRDDVASLLRLAPSAERFLTGSSGTALVGTRLGGYQITGLLGAGGMGVVYRARDPHLDRDVAIKLLPAPFADDPGKVARFEREARLLALLDHPRIAAIHGLERADSHVFIVLELVDGSTLAEHAATRRLAVTDALRLATQIAEALEAAHERGIVHRDLKPSNVKVTADGSVKLLDFGLAKLVPDEAGGGSEGRATATGLIVGTAAYMSPEQARGQAVDRRTDVWAFGCVLFELLTGRRAFQGDTASDTLAAVLTVDPDWSILPASTPQAIRRLLHRCLDKDRARRPRDIGDVRLDIEQTLEAAANGEPRPTVRVVSVPARRATRRWAWLVLTVPVLIAGYAWRTWRPPQTLEPLRALALTTLPGAIAYPSLSPDANYVTFMWTGPEQDNADIYVQQIGAGGPLRLTTDTGSDYSPVWSPDGHWIAFLRAERLPFPSAPAGKSDLRLIAPLGGSERSLRELEVRIVGTPRFLAWCPDSSCLIVTDSQGEGRPDALYVVSRETGEKRRLTDPQPPLLGDCNPALSPDGRWLVFRRVPAAGAGELYALRLGANRTADGEPLRLTDGALNAAYPAWMPDSRAILFSSRESLWRLDVPGKGAPARLPFVGEDGTMPAIGRAQPGGSARLVYVRSRLDSNIWRVETPGPGAPASSPPVKVISSTRKDGVADYSPDGQRVVFTSDRSGVPELWLAGPDGSNAVQLTFLGGPVSAAARWSPDGRRIVFQSNVDGQFEIYLVAAAGGKPRRITTHPANDNVPGFSRDGQWIYFGSMRSGDYRVWKIPTDGGDAVQVTEDGGFRAIEGTDERFLYYTRDPGSSSLWRLPTSGGQPVRLLDGVIRSAFAVIDEGIYYIDQPTRQTRLRFFDFTTGRSTTIARDLGEIRSLLTTWRGGRSILYSRLDSSVDDLMLVDNLR